MSWRSKLDRGGMPRRLDRPDGSWAEVTVAPLSAALPYRFVATDADGRQQRGSAPDVASGEQRAEAALNGPPGSAAAQLGGE